MLWIVILLGAAWGVIYPFTDFFTRVFNPLVLKRGDLSQKIVHFSFDDGPDPEYTLDLLEVLKTYQVPASFFLVGKKAELHPEIVAKIREYGHEIGWHTYFHQHAYRMFFCKSKTSIRRGIGMPSALAGGMVTWFRPPWGALNLFQYLEVRRLGLRPVLWTANAQDWLLKSTSSLIVKRLAQRVRPGAIIVLHDSGGEPGAPANTLQALPEVIIRLRSEGYQFVPLRQLAGGHFNEFREELT
jgi:peptidoglycan/xylan/chitin deacetylase (PgdA/CDA1 family)